MIKDAGDARRGRCVRHEHAAATATARGRRAPTRAIGSLQAPAPRAAHAFERVTSSRTRRAGRGSTTSRTPACPPRSRPDGRAAPLAGAPRAKSRTVKTPWLFPRSRVLGMEGATCAGRRAPTASSALTRPLCRARRGRSGRARRRSSRCRRRFPSSDRLPRAKAKAARRSGDRPRSRARCTRPSARDGTATSLFSRRNLKPKEPRTSRRNGVSP